MLNPVVAGNGMVHAGVNGPPDAATFCDFVDLLAPAWVQPAEERTNNTQAEQIRIRMQTLLSITVPQY
jgi:hypothetical protein